MSRGIDRDVDYSVRGTWRGVDIDVRLTDAGAASGGVSSAALRLEPMLRGAVANAAVSSAPDRVAAEERVRGLTLQLARQMAALLGDVDLSRLARMEEQLVLDALRFDGGPKQETPETREDEVRRAEVLAIRRGYPTREALLARLDEVRRSEPAVALYGPAVQPTATMVVAAELMDEARLRAAADGVLKKLRERPANQGCERLELDALTSAAADVIDHHVVAALAGGCLEVLDPALNRALQQRFRRSQQRFRRSLTDRRRRPGGREGPSGAGDETT